MLPVAPTAAANHTMRSSVLLLLALAAAATLAAAAPSRNATSPTMHTMPARIARRKAAEAKKRAAQPVAPKNMAAAVAAGTWPPKRQTVAKPRVTPQPRQPPPVVPRPPAGKATPTPAAAATGKQPTKVMRPRQAKLSAAAVKASKPKGATPVPAFADLYVKGKAKTVGPQLQKLASVRRGGASVSRGAGCVSRGPHDAGHSHSVASRESSQHAGAHHLPNCPSCPVCPAVSRTRAPCSCCPCFWFASGFDPQALQALDASVL